MKIRNDFVTNSSSSSFIIAYRTPAAIDDDALKKFPILKFYDRVIQAIIDAEDCCGDTDEGEIYDTKEKFDEYFIESYGWRGEKTVREILDNHDEEYLNNLYDDVSRYFENGYGIIRKDVGYSDDGLRNMINTLAEDNEDFIIIESE